MAGVFSSILALNVIKVINAYINSESKMSSKAFYIAYDGPALENNQMAVKDLAPALLALSDLFDEANKVLNGSKADIRLDVKGTFKSGCFGIDLIVVQDLLASLINFLPSREAISTAADICEVLAFCGGSTMGLISVLRRLKGRKIKRIDAIDKKAVIYVDEEQIETEIAVIELLRNSRAREAVDASIAQPLEKEGIETVAFTDTPADPNSFCTIRAEEAAYFKAPIIEDEELEHIEYETNVQLLGVSFQENNKWRFDDGSSKFYAEILDKDFYNKINEHVIAFAKDDILKVRIREHQKITKEGLKTEKFIIKVLSHRSAMPQLALPFST